MNRKLYRNRISVSLLLLAALLAHAQSPQPQTQRPTSTPYKGDLSIFDYEGRDQKLQIQRVMDILDIKPGKVAADIGAGSGWFTVRAAKRAETVYAVDINPESVDYIQKRAAQENLANVRTILSKEDDPLLPPAAIDAVLIMKTYHEFAHPLVLLGNLRKSLRPGAKVGVIDKNGAGDNHGVNREVVIREFKQAGYELIGKYDFVKPDKMDYFLVFQLSAAVQ